MNAKQQREWEDDVTQPCAFPEPLAEVLTRENRELRAMLADATAAAQNLRDELQGAQERLRRVRELADEWELNDCDCECCREQLDVIALRDALGMEQVHD